MDNNGFPSNEEWNEARNLLWQSYLVFVKNALPSNDATPAYVKEFSEASNAYLDAISRLP
ncbi:hypothetical protein NZD89_05045 [Alicyclobacillus fastidiosus]|uniref:Uncharacterized protein n=1 Tax=Alicyclobacillus fastidiosus TaxID=392011 RepID=A0ABY6ZIQ1_9BACL|nr:hypothetical protein [Alicyclobacillus fastidiosus]WAH42799.1 hypothetical protein NZD89_05045 [Alicyclobacillus fastidiosus]GMA64720.1 hypothetical protein GCM10025859_51600 [Alicyclobacillus fastidiosus]